MKDKHSQSDSSPAAAKQKAPSPSKGSIDHSSHSDSTMETTNNCKVMDDTDAHVMKAPPDQASPQKPMEDSPAQAEEALVSPPHKGNNTGNDRETTDDGDDATQPETPEKDEFADEAFENDDENGLQLRGSPSPRKKSFHMNLDDAELGTTSKRKSSKTSKQHKPSRTGANKNRNRRRFRCKIAVCCLLSLFLLACIAILGYTLYCVRNDQEPSFFGVDIAAKFQQWFKGEKADGTDSSDRSADPVLMEMVRDSLLLATGAATGANTPVPGMMDINAVMEEPKSIQHSVLVWLANDPFIFDYSASKMLQRYVLGCFYWNLQATEMNKHVLNTWMTYQDECEMWQTTNKEMTFCDAQGQVVSIHLENVGLVGTIAPEVALLSNSLELLHLTDNKLQGSTPPALGQLTNLKRLQLSRNNLTGELPTLLGNLNERLEALSMSHNSLTGTFPSQITKLTNLIELNLSNNDLTGELPPGLRELTALSTLRLEENKVVGAISEDMCNRTSTVTNKVLAMTVDCGQVQCSCCKNCCSYCDLGGKGDSASYGTTSIASSPTTAPTVDPLKYPVASTPATTATFDCSSIQTGFSCYTMQFAIDFESSVCNIQATDMVAVFASSGTDNNVGTQRPLADALVWSSSCNLLDCDGVLSQGRIYYRNIIPDQWIGAKNWPLAAGSYFLAVIQVDASAMAMIVAESEAFSVAEQCLP